jgi:hypothetical protein
MVPLAPPPVVAVLPADVVVVVALQQVDTSADEQGDAKQSSKISTE